MLYRLVGADNFLSCRTSFYIYSCTLAYYRTFTHLSFIWQGLLRLGQGKAMKSRPDNECVLDSVLIGPQFICHVFPFKFIAMQQLLGNFLILAGAHKV